jgi:hypothetical protein
MPNPQSVKIRVSFYARAVEANPFKNAMGCADTLVATLGFGTVLYSHDDQWNAFQNSRHFANLEILYDRLADFVYAMSDGMGDSVSVWSRI